MYKIPYYETSAEIIIVGGQTQEVNESFKPLVLDAFQVKQISWKRDRKNQDGTLLIMRMKVEFTSYNIKLIKETMLERY